MEFNGACARHKGFLLLVCVVFLFFFMFSLFMYMWCAAESGHVMTDMIPAH